MTTNSCVLQFKRQVYELPSVPINFFLELRGRLRHVWQLRRHDLRVRLPFLYIKSNNCIYNLVSILSSILSHSYINITYLGISQPI